jgi:hypothetical protein
MHLELADHPADHLDPADEAARLRRWAERLEGVGAGPAPDPADPGLADEGPVP